MICTTFVSNVNGEFYKKLLNYASIQFEDCSDRVRSNEKEERITNHWRSFWFLEMADHWRRNKSNRKWLRRQTSPAHGVSDIRRKTKKAEWFCFLLINNQLDMKMVQCNSGMWHVSPCRWLLNWKQAITFILNSLRTKILMKKLGHHFERFDSIDWNLNEFLFFFFQTGHYDPYCDDPRLAIQKLALCTNTETLIIAGTAGQVLTFQLTNEPVDVNLSVSPKELFFFFSYSSFSSSRL